MESIWTENSIGIDVVPCHQALELIDEEVAHVLRGLWEDDESIAIAGELEIIFISFSIESYFTGGFVAFCLGLTTQYGDIDIFCHPLSFAEFSLRIQQRRYSVRSENRTVTNVYPDHQFTLYKVYDHDGFWTGCQVIEVFTPWLQFVAPLEGPLFARTLLRDFDLQICRAAIYKDSYIQR